MMGRRGLIRVFGASVAVLLVVLALGALYIRAESDKSASEDPRVWEADIRAIEADANTAQLPHQSVLFLGSSSIRLWSSLAEDMLPFAVIQRGFGGAKLNDLVYYAQRLVNVPSPRAIVVFAGTNDIKPNASKAPQQLLTSYRQFVAQVRTEWPALPIII